MLQGVDPQIVDVLLRTLAYGSLEFDKGDEALNRCFRMGYVHVEEPKKGRLICILPSLLHAGKLVLL